ncbi:MAG: hypothetical protein H6R13_1798 [Proteobacteria bacterium]|nr:hypothetical protein [Pseudomonadota bacterium]
MKNIIFSILGALLLSACSSFFSGSAPQPVVEDDRGRVRNASLYLSGIPSMTTKLSNESIKIIVVAFDGTENDRDSVDGAIERETVTAALARLLHSGGYDVDYIPGPGTGSKADAALCFTCIPKAEEALDRLRKKVEGSWAQSPNLEIRVLVLGFSRGAAIGRHFMNLVSQKWPPYISPGEIRDGHQIVRTVGLLFDTVATGKETALELGIAPTTDHLIHLLARDERRGLFHVVVDDDWDFISLPSSDCRHSDRLTEITLPGVHSDVGGSYLDGLGSIYRVLAEQILVELGLLDKHEWTIGGGAFNHGAHDSRGILDKLLLVKSALKEPDERRVKVLAKSAVLSEKEKASLKYRLDALKNAKWNNLGVGLKSIDFGSAISTSSFFVTKRGASLGVRPASDWIRPETVAFDASGSDRTLVFGGVGPDGKLAMSKVIISDKVWNGIPENDESRFEIVVHKPAERASLHFFVNGRELEWLETN